MDYRIINTNFDINEQESMDMIMKLLSSYEEKYNKIKYEKIVEEKQEKIYRKDTKVIYQLLFNNIANDTIVKEISQEFDNSETDKRELKEYLDFVDNIKYILLDIDTVDLLNPGNEYLNKHNTVISYIHKKNTEMKELTNTMGELSVALENIRNSLAPITNTI